MRLLSETAEVNFRLSSAVRQPVPATAAASRRSPTLPQETGDKKQKSSFTSRREAADWSAAPTRSAQGKGDRARQQRDGSHVAAKNKSRAYDATYRSTEGKWQERPQNFKGKGRPASPRSRYASSQQDGASRFASQWRETPRPAEPSTPSGAATPSRSAAEEAWNRQDTESVEEIIQSNSCRNEGLQRVLLGRSLQELQAVATAEGYPAFRGKQLFEGIMQGARSLTDISNIPSAMKENLATKHYVVGRSTLQESRLATDGTRKFLLRLHDGLVVESVGIPNENDSRLTACVSSQVGCPMRCTFCATGKGGFSRNLQAHEIVDQVLTIQEQFSARVSNVVFMGMGEPLLNMRGVLAANQFMTSAVGIGARHITISSVGVPNAIMKLASHRLQNTLAISIHAPTQELRETIVPSARMYPLEALMMDCHKYFEVTGRRITFEYTLMAGINDSTVQAKQLAVLLGRFGLKGHVNLIPWNPVEDSEYKRPTRAAVSAFTAALTDAGVTTSVRHTRGLEAAAACGQLRNQHQKNPLLDFAVA